MFRESAKKSELESKSNPEKKWTCVFFFNDWEEAAVAKWVKEMNEKSGQEVRYKRFLGATHIDGTGDLDKIRQTIKASLPDLNKQFYERDLKIIQKEGGNTADVKKYRSKFQYVKESDIEYWINVQKSREPEQAPSARLRPKR